MAIEMSDFYVQNALRRKQLADEKKQAVLDSLEQHAAAQDAAKRTESLGQLQDRSKAEALARQQMDVAGAEMALKQKTLEGQSDSASIAAARNKALGYNEKGLAPAGPETGVPKYATTSETTPADPTLGPDGRAETSAIESIDFQRNPNYESVIAQKRAAALMREMPKQTGGGAVPRDRVGDSFMKERQDAIEADFKVATDRAMDDLTGPEQARALNAARNARDAALTVLEQQARMGNLAGAAPAEKPTVTVEPAVELPTIPGREITRLPDGRIRVASTKTKRAKEYTLEEFQREMQKSGGA